MAVKQLSGTYIYTVVFSNYPSYAQFALDGLVETGNFLAVYGNASSPWALTNSGHIVGAGGVQSDSGGAAGTIVNTGTIEGTATSGTGVLLQTGGAVENHALIEGRGNALWISGAAGTIANTGTVSGATGTGIYLDGGAITNGTTAETSALIAGAGIGIYTPAGASAATIDNYGTIVASGSNGAGIFLQSGGTVVNRGAVLGSGTGIWLSAPASTIVNAGTIAGNGVDSVYLAGGNDRLVVYPGAVLAGGTVAGQFGTATNTLELAVGQGVGTLVGFGSGASGIGADLSAFDSLVVDPGAVWQVSEAGAQGLAVSNAGTIGVPRLGMLTMTSDSAGAGGTIELSSRSTVEAAGPVGASQRLAFAGGDATLILDDPASFAGMIDGFAAGDAIELETPATQLVYAGTTVAGSLTIMNGSTAVGALLLAGGTDYSQAAFSLGSDGAVSDIAFAGVAGSGFVIDPSFDASVATAPAGFLATMNQGFQWLESTIADPITMHLEVGWGEIENTVTIQSGGLGGPLGGGDYSYAQLAAVLPGYLSGPDPTGGRSICVGGAEAKALGLVPAIGAGLDGVVGFAEDTTSPDFFGGVIHEVTHAMGRVADLPVNDTWTVLDLFRYTAPGTLAGTATNGVYFSIDGGNTAINYFSNGSGLPPASADYGDWSGLTPDAFNNVGGGPVTPGDLTVMQALGFTLGRRSVSDDFYGFGTSDVLWQNAGGGGTATWIWQMNGLAQVGGGPSGSGGGGYQIAATGDFNADGKADILWTNPASGDTWIWTMNGTAVTANDQVGAGGAGYDIVGTGDFYGTGTSDILWNNPSSGDTWIWQMNGSQIVANSEVGQGGSGYQILGTGSFSPGGNSDILWENPATGDTWIWTMNGSTVAGNQQIGVGGAGYDIVGTGDFYGTGTSDILWSNPSTGDTWIWEMNGSTIVANTEVGQAGAGYQVVGTGDYNGDGKADILWENPTTGDTWIWAMNGSQVAANVQVGQGGGGWSIVNTDPDAARANGAAAFAFGDIAAGAAPPAAAPAPPQTGGGALALLAPPVPPVALAALPNGLGSG